MAVLAPGVPTERVFAIHQIATTRCSDGTFALHPSGDPGDLKFLNSFLVKWESLSSQFVISN